MSEKDPIRLFITHAFQEHEEYLRVFEFLESRENFYYLNYSDPAAKLVGAGQEMLQEEIRRQIKPVEAVLFPLGVYTQNPRLIHFELTVAQAFKKPVIAIQAHGGTLTLPQEEMQLATEVVDWNERTISDAIRRLGRGEDVAQWDVIDFDPD